MLGPTEKQARTLAVKTKSLVTLRDADITARGMIAEEAPYKKPDEATLDALENKMHRADGRLAENDIMDRAAQMIKAAATSQAAGHGDTALGSVGRAAIDIGDLQNIMPEEEEEEEDPEAAADDGEAKVPKR